MTIYKIDVTQEDLERGMPQRSGDDPIALAVKRVMNLKWVSVGGDGQLGFETGYYFQLPKRIIKRIKRIDNYEGVTGKMRPFSFEIDDEKLQS